MSSGSFELQKVDPVFSVRDLGEAVDYYRDCVRLPPGPSRLGGKTAYLSSGSA